MSVNPICPVCREKYVFPSGNKFYTFDSELGKWLGSAPAEHLIRHQLEKIAYDQAVQQSINKYK